MVGNNEVDNPQKVGNVDPRDPLLARPDSSTEKSFGNREKTVKRRGVFLQNNSSAQYNQTPC